MTGYDLMHAMQWAATGALLMVAAIIAAGLGILTAIVLVWWLV